MGSRRKQKPYEQKEQNPVRSKHSGLYDVKKLVLLCCRVEGVETDLNSCSQSSSSTQRQTFAAIFNSFDVSRSSNQFILTFLFSACSFSSVVRFIPLRMRKYRRARVDMHVLRLQRGLVLYKWVFSNLFSCGCINSFMYPIWPLKQRLFNCVMFNFESGVLCSFRFVRAPLN